MSDDAHMGYSNQGCFWWTSILVLNHYWSFQSHFVWIKTNEQYLDGIVSKCLQFCWYIQSILFMIHWISFSFLIQFECYLSFNLMCICKIKIIFTHILLFITSFLSQDITSQLHMFLINFLYNTSSMIPMNSLLTVAFKTLPYIYSFLVGG